MCTGMRQAWHYNLVSSDQLNQSGFKVVLDNYNTGSVLQQKPAFRMAGSDHPVSLPASKISSLYLLPVHWQPEGAPPPNTPWQHELDHDLPRNLVMLANGSNLTLEELVHLLMAHTPI
eukprot:2776940-Rhodomonas_salina.2